MKILVVNTVATAKNGITNVIFNYINAIKNKSIVFDLVAINDVDAVYEDMITQTGGRVYTFYRNNILLYVYRLSRIIRENKYDIVHIHGNSHTLCLELLAAIIGGCQVRIIHAHSTSCISVKLHNLLYTPFNMMCTHRLACSQGAGKFMFESEPFTIINNGVDVSKYAYDEQKRKELRSLLRITDDKLLIGHVGYFLALKNHDFIIKVFSQLVSKNDRYRLVLIGDGALRSNVENQVKTLGLEEKVYFTGNIDNVSDYLNAIDLIIMPSIYEGLPLTLIEQQANGLNCVVSDNITNEVDKTGNVMFLPLEKGAAQWADIIAGMNNTADRVLTSRNAIMHIENAGYSIEKEAIKLSQLYQSLCPRE